MQVAETVGKSLRGLGLAEGIHAAEVIVQVDVVYERRHGGADLQKVEAQETAKEPSVSGVQADADGRMGHFGYLAGELRGPREVRVRLPGDHRWGRGEVLHRYSQAETGHDLAGLPQVVPLGLHEFGEAVAGPPDVVAQPGMTDDRGGPELAKALDYCRDGDVLVVYKLDRLGRSLKELLEIVTGLEERGVGFRSLREVLGTKPRAGDLSFTSSRFWRSSSGT